VRGVLVESTGCSGGRQQSRTATPCGVSPTSNRARLHSLFIFHDDVLEEVEGRLSLPSSAALGEVPSAASEYLIDRPWCDHTAGSRWYELHWYGEHPRNRSRIVHRSISPNPLEGTF
jgi:hypothetical protein